MAEEEKKLQMHSDNDLESEEEETDNEPEMGSQNSHRSGEVGGDHKDQIISKLQEGNK